MIAVDVTLDEFTGAQLVAELKAAGAPPAMVVMVRSGLSIIADRIRDMEIDPEDPALPGDRAAALVDPDAGRTPA